MLRIYAKLIIDGRVCESYIHQINGGFVIQDFFDYLQEICSNLDIPNPIILTKHIKNFIIFDSTTFLPEDFVESFPYDKLVLEVYK